MDQSIPLTDGNDRFLRLGDVIVDLDRNLVLRDGELTRLEPKAIEVLRYLAGANGRVVSRDELMREVWRVHVVDEAVQRVIAILRQALGSPGPQSVVIETLPRKGYRLLVDAAAIGVAIVDPPPSTVTRGWFALVAAFAAGLVAATIFLSLVDPANRTAPEAPAAPTGAALRGPAAAPPAPAAK